ncbi:metallophosphoesterase family protein [Algoriphagus sediminis]|uniref:Phosphoesterase n=1 Tax=Algoriphagus sediminis TaxID=3057113 RepID=A0ABT7YGS1_9BACT|nr:metallophosphoesterase family protein [Algoriphagus sediminis]MDN3205718.1 metallophosphoesterase family protein [Algoriphagus sediminis]
MSTKIALISDSHGYIDDAILKNLMEVDEIWHAGDIGDEEVMKRMPKGKKVRAVFGNIDDQKTAQKYPEWEAFELEQVKVAMTHIGGKPPRYSKGIKAKLKELRPNLFICGHSHICKVEFDPALNCLYMNPGAIGRQGFHQIRTMLLFELDSGEVKNLRVVELGKRGK